MRSHLLRHMFVLIDLAELIFKKKKMVPLNFVYAE